MSTVRRTVTIPHGLDDLLEKARRRLGLPRSRLYTVALTEYLRGLGILSERVRGVLDE